MENTRLTAGPVRVQFLESILDSIKRKKVSNFRHSTEDIPFYYREVKKEYSSDINTFKDGFWDRGTGLVPLDE